MPIDVNIPLSAGRDVPVINPVGAWMQMRDLLDERRYRRAQLEQQQAQQRRLQMQFEVEQEDRRRAQSFREGVARGLTPDQLMGIDPAAAMNLGRYRSELQGEQSQRETSALNRETAQVQLGEARRTQQRRLGQEYVDAIESIYQYPEPEREQRWQQQQMQWIRQNTMMPDEITTLPSRAELAAQMRTQYGVPTAETMEETRRQRTRAQADQQMKDAEALLNFVRDQPSYEEFLKALPEQIARKLPGTFMAGDLPKLRNLFRTQQQQATQALSGMPNTIDELIMWRNMPGQTPENVLAADKAIAQAKAYHLAVRPVIGVGTPTDAATWGDMVLDGEATLAQVPQAQRNAVATYIRNSGRKIVTPRQRQALSGIEVINGLIDQIETIAMRVNTKYGFGALTGGALQQAMAAAQADPDAQQLQSQVAFLGNFARGLGSESGAMSNQDIDRMLQAIPTIGLSAEVTRRRIADARNVARLRHEAILRETGRSFERDQDGGGGGQTAPPLPLQLQDSDKGKIFVNRAGQRIRITDINPQDRTQYKFEVVP